MRKRTYLLMTLLLAALCGGCGKDEFDIIRVEPIKTQPQQEKEPELNNKIEIDFDYDYTEDIKKDVEYVVSNSSSLQKELENIDKITQKYNPLAEEAQTQGEMNAASKWLFVIWDTELNNLWSRFSESADADTKGRVLAEQRNWIALKAKVVSIELGPREEGGSIYPLLYNTSMEEITKNRAYILANELAKIKGETFTMPERTQKYGLFVDNQKTDEIYSYLITRQGMEGDDQAVISIYRQGEIEGTFSDKGKGELDFTSYDGSVKGIIKLNGWDGASFEVTEVKGEAVLAVGEKFTFPFGF